MSVFPPLVPWFPTKIISNIIEIPKNIEIGDIIAVRYKTSQWGNYFPYEDWHHIAIVSKLHPLTIIEAVGEIQKKQDQPAGPYEITFNKALGFGKSQEAIIKMKWLKPKFPTPLREMSDKKWSERKIISEEEARKRVVNYARSQIGDNYKLSKNTWKQLTNKQVDLSANNATKWDENEWYCSLLIFKSFSRTLTNMYLEVYDLRNEKGEKTLLGNIRSGFFVTPEDIVDSSRTQAYFTWYRKNFYYNINDSKDA
jgi:hypothetical protein